jgi:deoxyribodipyrimidine photo-lyase
MEQLAAGCQIGQHYPEPIVDHLTAVRFAKAQFAGVRRSQAGQADKKTVMQRHGSRKNRSR